LSGATLPSRPLDGSDIWPILSGQQVAIERGAFLYFDSWNLQCVRVGPWKLHVSRYNDFAWSPDPIGGRVNLPLANPELYNLERDPDESYNVASEHPAIVAQIQAQIQQMLPSFPPAVMSAWQATMSQKVAPTLDGALPVSAPQ
jgi:hypothetical protein